MDVVKLMITMTQAYFSLVRILKSHLQHLL